jgi:hypothetical protein
MGEVYPVRRLVGDRVHDDGLADDECRKRKEVDPVDPLIDDEVSGNAQKNQQVNASVKRRLASHVESASAQTPMP